MGAGHVPMVNRRENFKKTILTATVRWERGTA